MHARALLIFHALPADAYKQEGAKEKLLARDTWESADRARERFSEKRDLGESKCESERERQRETR